MLRFAALVAKELRVLGKDWHGLLVLFVMPAVFILIMSLAMRDSFSERQAVAVEFVVVDEDHGEAAKRLLESLGKQEGFKLSAQPDGLEAARGLIANDHVKFGLVIPEGWQEALSRHAPTPESRLRLLVAPSAMPQLRALFAMAVSEAANRLFLSERLSRIPAGILPTEVDVEASPVAVNTEYVFKDRTKPDKPTSVQQSVPAWLVFSMFFVVIPISTAYIVERQQGTLLRLQIMNLPPLLLLTSKVVPYYIINQVQMVLMLLVGVFLVPLLGGDTLQLQGSPGGLALISSATSLAAIGFALLISTIASTHVQATTLGGVSNIIFGALGGIMVPKFVMPAFMQEVSVVSPMSWGLEGFLDVLLRRGPWTDVIPETLALLLFAAGSILAATVLFRR